MAAAALTPLALLLAAQAELPPEPAPVDAPPVVNPEPGEPAAVDPAIIDGRRRPDYTEPLPDAVSQTNEGAVRAPRRSRSTRSRSPTAGGWSRASAS